VRAEAGARTYICQARLIYFDAMQPGEVLSCAQALEMFVPVTLLFFAAADTVMRRLAAGTLLEGTCRVAEETWFLLVQEDVLKRTPGQTLSEAALVGRML